MLPEFEFYKPASIKEAVHILANEADHAALIAGGTNMVVDMRAGRHNPKVLVDIEQLPGMNTIERKNGSVCVGGAVTISEILQSPIIHETAAGLQSAASVFASPLVRNRATVGGNLGDASPAADSAPSLLALDAEVELTSDKGVRWVTLEQFFVGVRKTVRRPDEIITSVKWKAADSNSKSAFYKLGLRKADAISVISVAVLVEKGPNGICEKARIAMGSVAPRPIRAAAAENFLTGKKLTKEIIAEAARLASEGCTPISDVRSSSSYRRRMVEVYTRRLLTNTAE